ncbi:MAG: Cytosolic seryl-tRNA synthetase [Pleopsidium flavum]|nr:MAG: Cytosolic seryl-tRNA synthetase [Pleopsidium flavum]
MLDVFDFIEDKGGDPKKIRESQRRRYAPEEAVDEVIALYEDHRKSKFDPDYLPPELALTRPKYEASQIGTKINANQKEIGLKKRAQEDASELLLKKADLDKAKKVLEESALEKEAALQRKIRTIGNYVHDSDFNGLIRDWTPQGKKPEKRDCLSHHEVLTRLDGYDPERGVKIVGHRGYCLTGYGLFLNLALVNYGLEFLWRKGYKPNQPPHFMLRDYMAKTAQLEQFDEELYKVTDDGEKQTDKYLIATSEQPLSALHDGEWLQEKELPIKYAGYSTCYRKEAGAHGKDAWGIFRVHQFEKIEQFILTKPEDSWQAFGDMIGISEEFYRSLGLPYRIMAIVSGALNNAASKKYDLEAWFPFQGEYKELVSCSNCTDYQSRALDIRYGTKTQTDIKKKYVHALNSTLCATERALCCLLENYQTETGVNVPEVLRKYIPGAPEYIQYTKELPKDTTSQKIKGKASGPKSKVAPATEEATNKMGNLGV